ncbi:MAG TPA: hypothetical protein VIV11_05400, partial [Kofleriaceae bacterium]
MRRLGAFAVALLAMPAAGESSTPARPRSPEPGCTILDYGNYVPETKQTRHADIASITGERF